MAQDQNRPQQQQQQPQAGKQPGFVSPSSPFYSKDNLPKGDIIPSASWLFDRNWRCLGEPSWPNCEWYDPMKPTQGEEKQEVECWGYVERLDHKDRDANGRPKLVWKYERLMDQDGTTTGNRNVPITQTIIVPPAAAMTLQEAIRCQLDRERRSVEETRKQQQKVA